MTLITPEDVKESTSYETTSDETLIYVGKEVILPETLPEFDEEFYKWKKNFWKERIRGIKKIVAPMVDQSELAFRAMMRAHGADLCYSPMIHAHLFVNDTTYRKNAFSTLPSDRPLIVQFCANSPETFLDACRLVEGFCDGVDLNLGCPQVIAKRGHYGAFLQEEPQLIATMISMVYKHCRLPLSVKIRILSDLPSTLAYAKMVEEAGASMLTVHGRNRDQKGVLTGLADWSYIKVVKEALTIPVIANGNIQMPGDVEKCLSETRVDAVMSAEGILYNPYLFADRIMPNFMAAREYLKYADKYKANISAIRAHIFRFCHYSLLKYDDLRHRTSVVFNLHEFMQIVDELEAKVRAEVDSVQEWEQYLISTNYVSLHKLIESTPHWFSKPYIRPPQVDGPSESEFRVQRRAEIEKLSLTTGLSKRQIRKRERRKIELEKERSKKQTYPVCKKCKQPAGSNCENATCRKCCKWICVREGKMCKAHRFDAEKMKEKRDRFLASKATHEASAAVKPEVKLEIE